MESTVYTVSAPPPKDKAEAPEGEQMYSSTLPSTSALDGGWVVSATPRQLYPWERTGTRCIGGWVGPRAGLDGCGKSRPPPGFDSRTVQSVASPLYRLSYPGQCTSTYVHKILWKTLFVFTKHSGGWGAMKLSSVALPVRQRCHLQQMSRTQREEHT